MSGGIDSSVAAALLKKRGFQVEGVFMKLSPVSPENEENQVRQICNFLEIPFRVLDLRKEFKNKIINSFIEDYKKGLTPNPCVVCNKEIKFGLSLNDVLSKNDVLMATGHYIRLRRKNLNSKKQIANKLQIQNYKLLRGKDKTKDQSYFLWTLSQNQLEKTIFPLGKYTKKQVRKMAKKFKIPFLNRPESQEICFVKESLNEFLAQKIETKRGNILNPKGEVIGQHQGLHFYTIGQRKGIELDKNFNSLGDYKNTKRHPWYVVDKDIENNNLIVSRDNNDLIKKEFIVNNVNFISGKEMVKNFRARTKIRYGFLHKSNKSKIFPLGQNRFKVIFKKPQRAITPGQSAVFYRGRKLLGGGIIEKIA